MRWISYHMAVLCCECSPIHACNSSCDTWGLNSCLSQASQMETPNFYILWIARNFGVGPPKNARVSEKYSLLEPPQNRPWKIHLCYLQGRLLDFVPSFGWTRIFWSPMSCFGVITFYPTIYQNQEAPGTVIIKSLFFNRFWIFFEKIFVEMPSHLSWNIWTYFRFWWVYARRRLEGRRIFSCSLNCFAS